MINKQLNPLIDFMINRTDGIPGSDNCDDIAVLIGESITLEIIEYFQDYINQPSTDNANALAKKLTQTFSDYVEKEDTFRIMQ
ncbi:MAG: hypothetical protein COA94_05195 [Rickettsiales bacterium]|nr:MAG: hypothetical protein COA94_05195 [Rickettsiales bacterium]